MKPKEIKKYSGILALLAIFGHIPEKKPTGNIQFSHKKLMKSGITKHRPKPGRNRPAKGYDQIARKWIKE
jgi:hypothetical protein